MPSYEAFNLVPKLAPPVFVYFDILGSYVNFGGDAMTAAVNAGAGDMFGELIWNFMTNTATSFWRIIQCGASYFLGAFIMIRFLLPLTGITPSRIVLAIAASLGGHMIKWFMGLFLNK